MLNNEDTYIVLITVDTLRADEAPKQFFFKKMAGQGVLLKNHYSTGPDTPHAFPSIHTFLPPYGRASLIGMGV